MSGGLVQRLEEIESNRTDGAAVLAEKALDALALCARDGEALNDCDAEAALRGLVGRMFELRPSMAAIGTQVMLAFDHAEKQVRRMGAGWAAAIEVSVSFYKHRAHEANRLIAGHARQLCGTGRRVITCSFSSTLMSVFEHVQPKALFIGDGAPLGDGVRAAKALSARGLPATVIPDGALSVMTERAEMVLLGADQILNDGAVVNRTSSLTLALAARHFGLPLYVFCHHSKISGTAISELVLEPLFTTEDKRDNSGSTVPLFDVTPAHLVVGVVTEDGVLEAGKLRETALEMARLRRTFSQA